MSLQLRTAFEIPPETRGVARAAFPHGTRCLQLSEHFGALDGDERFADLFPRRGQPASVRFFPFRELTCSRTGDTA